MNDALKSVLLVACPPCCLCPAEAPNKLHSTQPVDLMLSIMRLLTRQLLPALLAALAWGFGEELDFLCEVALLAVLGLPCRQRPAIGGSSTPPGLQMPYYRSRRPRSKFKFRLV